MVLGKVSATASPKPPPTVDSSADGVTAHEGRVRPVEGSSSVVDTTVAGVLHI